METKKLESILVILDERYATLESEHAQLQMNMSAYNGAKEENRYVRGKIEELINEREATSRKKKEGSN
jgi:hypothetical protein